MKGLVQFNDVSFHYEGADENVLEHVTFYGPARRDNGLHRSTGSGKSTLINPHFPVLRRIGRQRHSGRRGRSATSHSMSCATPLVMCRRKACCSAGTSAPICVTAARDADADVLRRAAEVAQATEFIDELPDGFETAISQGGTNVSGRTAPASFHRPRAGKESACLHL